MRVLAAVCCPGPAEGLAPVLRLLRRDAHDVRAIAVSTRRGAPQRFAGSAAVFDREGLPYDELHAVLDPADPDQIPEPAIDRLVTDAAPTLILVGTSRDPAGTAWGVEEGLVRVAAERQIPAVQFVDSWEAWYPRAGDRHPAAAYVVPDQLTQRIVRERGGVDRARIRVTGNPGWERFLASSPHDRAALRRQLGVSERHRLLVYFGDAGCDEATTLYWALRHRAPMDRVLFRRHPRDTRDYGPLADDFPEAFIPVHLESDVLLRCADLCLTHVSAMGVKAALAGICTINFILPGDCESLCRLCGGFPLAVLGGSYQVDSETAYRRVLQTSRPPDPAKLRRRLGLDGQAAQRIADVCAEVAGRQAPRPANLGRGMLDTSSDSPHALSSARKLR